MFGSVLALLLNATNALDFNQWQHLALTYDGSTLRLYKNGTLIGNTAANGTITQTTQNLQLGTLFWQGSGFPLNGRLDEIRLWDVAVSQTEISSWMCSGLDNSHPNWTNLTSILKFLYFFCGTIYFIRI